MQRTMRCGSWVAPSAARSGGMKSASMPLAVSSQPAPSSSVVQTPPQLTPTTISPARVGWGLIEWMPGTS